MAQMMSTEKIRPSANHPLIAFSTVAGVFDAIRVPKPGAGALVLPGEGTKAEAHCSTHGRALASVARRFDSLCLGALAYRPPFQSCSSSADSFCCGSSKIGNRDVARLLSREPA